MSTIQLSANAGADCLLRLDVPVGESGSYDVVVRVTRRDNTTSRKPTPEELGWPSEFVQSVMGSIDDDKFVRPPQPMYEPVPPLDLE